MPSMEVDTSTESSYTGSPPSAVDSRSYARSSSADRSLSDTPSPHASSGSAGTSESDELASDIDTDSAPVSVLDLASRWPTSGRIVPQKIYSSPRDQTGGPGLLEPIMFVLKDPDQCGISCRDALFMIVSRLEGRDDEMFSGCGTSVSLRLMWPGYPSWARQIPTRDFRRPPGPITRTKLAKIVARSIQRFLEDMAKRSMSPDADRRWKLGAGGIAFEDLDILGLQHVSMGSWQVFLRVRR